MKTIQMFFKMYGLLLSKKEQYNNTCRSPYYKDYTLYNFIYISIWKRKNYRNGMGLGWLRRV